MKNIKIKSLGPIKYADIDFGSLTLLVGPQASGKSIFLQLVKLLIDKAHIRGTLEKYGFTWSKKEEEVLDRYFGEGMSGIWNKDTKIVFDKKEYPISFLKTKKGESSKRFTGEKLFYIPAQRVVCLQNGWPRYFTEYEDSVPFVLRDFSENLRQLLETGINDNNQLIFPQNQLLKEQTRKSINDSIFHNGRIRIDRTGKKKFKLDIGKSSIPYMVWSAGQKEFMPLLLSFYYLSPPSGVSTRENIKYVVIEEPEMGLHPEAIKSVLLQVMDLMCRNYQVIISTHSQVFLEFAWAIRHLQKSKSDFKALAKLFEINTLRPSIKKTLEFVIKSKINTYYFNGSKDGVNVSDISTLDAGSEDLSIADWGGLSSFSSKAIEIVSNSGK